MQAFRITPIRSVLSLLLAVAVTGLAVAAGKEEGKLPVTGEAVPELEALDGLVARFLEKHQIPGASLAVTRDGRLVYARGFGYADRDKKEPVKPGSLFRLASVSKPITTTAVLQLVERGKLRLDARVYDLLKLEPHLESGAKLDPRWKQITVEEVLHHRGGWDAQASFDPMFRPVPIARALSVDVPPGPKSIIRYMLGRPLDYDPGTKEVYSNFGYCVLGRVVENVGGKPYEAYIQKELLAPLGIKNMRIGRSTEEGRLPGEVKYYDSHLARAIVGSRRGKQVPEPYGAWSLEAMDAHGGWVASAADVARFASAFDEPERFPALGGEAIQNWFRRVYVHTGSLPGSSTVLARPGLEGVTWAVLFNSREGGTKDKEPADLIQAELETAMRGVKEWPQGDQFPKLLP